MEAFLEVIQGADQGQLLPLGDGAFTVGRGAGNKMRLSDSTVSRQHVKFFRSGGRFLVADQNSTHGTFVNGARVTRHELTEGDEIRIGETVLCFRTGDPSRQSTPEPADHKPGPAAPAGSTAPSGPGAPADGDLVLELPDSAPASRPRPPTPAPDPPRDGLTEKGEDPFAADELELPTVAPRSAAPPPPSPPATPPPARPRPARAGPMSAPVSSVPLALQQGRFGPKRAAEKSGVLHQELDQRSAVTRWVAVVFAIAVALGIGYGAMTAISFLTSAPEKEEAPPLGPQRPIRPGPR